MTLKELMNFMDEARNDASTRAQFDAGFRGLADPAGAQPLRQTTPVWEFVEGFNIPSRVQPNGELWTYDFITTPQAAITNDTTIVSCGADTLYVDDIFTKDEIQFLPEHNEIAFKMCRERCTNEQSFLDEFNSKEYNTGLAFHTLASTKFWSGTATDQSVFNSAGRNEVVYYDFVGTDYSDLTTASASTLANFFYQMIYDVQSPVIFIGPVTAEIIGWRQQGTGDNCSEVWDCMISILANRLNVDVNTVLSYFQTNPIFDNVIGIDINAPANADSVVMVLDRSKLRMGVNEVERTDAFAIKDDQAHTRRRMWMTGLQKRAKRSVIFGYNFVDEQVVSNRIGDRYAPEPIPELQSNRVA